MSDHVFLRALGKVCTSQNDYEGQMDIMYVYFLYFLSRWQHSFYLVTKEPRRHAINQGCYVNYRHYRIIKINRFCINIIFKQWWHNVENNRLENGNANTVLYSHCVHLENKTPVMKFSIVHVIHIKCSAILYSQ